MSIKKGLCKCGCNKRVSKLKNKYIWGHFPKPGRNRLPRKIRFCKCGCEQTFECKINSNKKYILGHQGRGKPSGMLGKHHSEETRRKMGEAQKKRFENPENRPNCKGVNNPFYGRHHTKKTKKKIGESRKIRREIRKCKCRCGQIFECKINSKRRFINYHSQRVNNSMSGKHWTKKHIEQKRKSMLGESNPNWQGGTGKLGYPFTFNEKLKKQIRKRDNYTCQFCSKREKKNNRRLDIHHIDYNKNNLNFSNLITLCRSCNTMAGYDKEFWVSFFQRKIDIIKKKVS